MDRRGRGRQSQRRFGGDLCKEHGGTRRRKRRNRRVKALFIVFVVSHELIHLMGPAKAFGYAALPQLEEPISKSLALVWLLASAALLATAALFVIWPRGWWMLGAVAAILSQFVILTSWTGAKYGTIANAVLLVGVVSKFGRG